jgi:predicted metal-dependent phosphotriesterase family hydrolase
MDHRKTTDRRDFLKHALTAGVVVVAGKTRASASPLQVMTVAGPIEASEMGPALSHEHVLVDFIGAEEVHPGRYRREDAFQAALPHLKRLKAAGCRTLVEATPEFLGRDPLLLKELSEASGLYILTNSGNYGARRNVFLPERLQEASPEVLAERWLREWKSGIDDTGIRPGFLKLGVDAGPLSPIHRNLIRAAAWAHLESGLTVAVHTGDGKAAHEQASILRQEGVSPEAWIWVHAQNERDQEIHFRLAELGGWLGWDGISPESSDRSVSFLQRLKERGLLDRVLISQDAGWYSVGEEGGGSFRPYDYLFEEFLPSLSSAGFSETEVRRLIELNPAEAFAIRVRRK